MGSFNTSCLVSRQIIVPGAEVVILPISQQGTYNPVEISKGERKLSQYGFAHTTCYPTAFWGYAGPMIRGKYYDYGRFDILDTPENYQNMLCFFKKLSEDAFKTYQGEPRNLAFAVIHHAAADYLIKHVNEAKDYDGHSYEQKAYFERYAQKNLARMFDVFKNKSLKDMMSFYATQVASLSNYRMGEQEGTHLSHYYDSWEPVMDLIETYIESEPASETLPNELTDKLFELFKTQIEHRYLHVGLDWFDIKLAPMVYASQDYDNSTGKSYARLVRSVSAQINKEVKEQYDD